MTEVKKSSFANLDAIGRISMASLGGRTAHALGKAHKFTSDSARAAGLKGVEARRRNAAAKGVKS